MTASLEAVLHQAKVEGLLPADAVLPEVSVRPWPVVLLTGLGAWLAAGPLLLVAAFLLNDLVPADIGPFLVGVLELVAAVVVLRARNVSLFVEQMAVPVLIVGAGCLAFALIRDMPDGGAAGGLALLEFGLACLLPRAWLRGLLGAAAAVLAMLAVTPAHFVLLLFGAVPWLGVHGLLIVWLGALRLQHTALEGRGCAMQAALEPIMAGWLLALLAMLAVQSGTGFLVGGIAGVELAGVLGRGAPMSETGLAVWGMSVASAGFVLAATVVAARAWPTLRQPLPFVAMLAATGLACLLPALGAACLVLALTLTTGRRLQAGAAALAIAWIIGSFYYQLEWTLAFKALVLVVLASLFALMAWRMRAATSMGAALGALSRRAMVLPACAAIAAIAIVNVGIWRNEALIANGSAVFVELTPVDPRSLMQGDFMRLAFRMPEDVQRALHERPLRGRPLVVARRDAHGVAQIVRLHREGQALAQDELRIELTPRNGRWVLVTDAWFFAEGEGARWEAARYGEFRVNEKGRALLTGMADENLQPIRP